MSTFEAARLLVAPKEGAWRLAVVVVPHTRGVLLVNAGVRKVPPHLRPRSSAVPPTVWVDLQKLDLVPGAQDEVALLGRLVLGANVDNGTNLPAREGCRMQFEMRRWPSRPPKQKKRIPLTTQGVSLCAKVCWVQNFSK